MLTISSVFEQSTLRLRNAGFTLIELVITVAIVGGLSSIAFPSFQAYMQDGRRSDVQHYVLQQVAILERQYTREGGYRNAGNGTADFKIDRTDYYYFTYVPTATTVLNDQFKLTITPINSQADDKCGVMTIDHAGKKEADIAGCWS